MRTRTAVFPVWSSAPASCGCARLGWSRRRTGTDRSTSGRVSVPRPRREPSARVAAWPPCSPTSDRSSSPRRRPVPNEPRRSRVSSRRPRRVASERVASRARRPCRSDLQKQHRVKTDRQRTLVAASHGRTHAPRRRESQRVPHHRRGTGDAKRRPRIAPHCGGLTGRAQHHLGLWGANRVRVRTVPDKRVEVQMKARAE